MTKETPMNPRPTHRRLIAGLRLPLRARAAVLAVLLAALALAAAPGTAAAAIGPRLQVALQGLPTNFAPGDASGNDRYFLTVTNVGDQPTCDASADPSCNITINDALPPGLSVTGAEFYTPGYGSTSLASVLCSSPPAQAEQCSYPGQYAAFLSPLKPGETLTLLLHVQVAGTVPSTPPPSPCSASATTPPCDSATVSGGGGPDASASWTTPIGATPAGFRVQTFAVSAINPDGSPDTRAGSHPYELTTSFDYNTVLRAQGAVGPAEDPKDITTDLPPGLIGDPQAVPQCPLAQFAAATGEANGQGSRSKCPADTQVGTAAVNQEGQIFTSPVYNLQPEPGAPAELGLLFSGANGVPVVLKAGLRTGGDYGLRLVSSGITEISLSEVSVTIWGDPGDPSHDWQRGQFCESERDVSIPQCNGGGVPGPAARPFLTLPSDCSGQPLSFGITTVSWLHPGAPQTASAALPALTGCDLLSSFDPTISVAPDSSQAGQPAGLSVDIKAPQNDAPLALMCGSAPCDTFANPAEAGAPTGVDYTPVATPEVRDVTVALPAGMTVNPSGADGLGSCSDQQIALSSPDPGACPDSSKIGTVQLHTPLLPNSLPGDVYVGQPQCSPCSPADAAAGRMVRLFIQIDDPASGVVVKLPGTVSVDQSTGQLTSTFLQNPQLPFDELQLSLKGGSRAPLVNPDSCGTFTTTSDFAPWSAPFSGPDATPFSSFDVTGCGDPSTFAPSFTAGVQNMQAGAHSSFVLSFSRSDADQQLSGLSVSLPPGLSAKLAGVPLCSDSDAAAGTCPASSQVGDVETGAGAGSEPLFLPGHAYLTGPYKGGPYGLAVEVPAIAGPYNLGTVVVRQAIHVDPTTAQVTVVSDPFPQSLDGIPLRLRRVDVNMDRPDFIVNPTSCNPMSIDGTLSSTGGMSEPVSSRFQVGACGELGFSPKLQFKLTGNGQTHSGNHPTLTATLTQGAGQANMRSAKVALPLSLALDINNSKNVCNYDVAQAVHGGAVGCPASTIVGQATAVTPLLDQPLSGPVYLVQGIRFGKGGQRIHTLPSLLVPLRGQIAIDLRASSAVNGAQQLVTTFSNIPDAPVSKFTLQINGGRKGLLVITGRGKSICGAAQVANSDFGGQSGRADNQNDTMATPCGRAARKHVNRHGKRHGRRHGKRM
jgi:hypothetical protein